MGDRAIRAIGIAGFAAGSAVKDKTMAKQRPAAALVFGDDIHQVEFQFNRVGVGGQPQPPRQPYHVRIADDALDAEAIAQNNIGGFASNAGKREQFIHCLRDNPAEAVDKQLAGFLDAGRLVAIKARRADILFEFFARQGNPVFGFAVLLKQRFGDDIDPGIGALSGKNRGNQQFQRIGMVEGDFGVRITLTQNREKLQYPPPGVVDINFEFLFGHLLFVK